MPEGIKRSLAAVMFTDMVGYTAMMQADEQLALVKRNRHREVLEETHKGFHGKIIQYFGDGTLSIFDSVVEAVRCAIAIQTALQKAPQVPLRIGLHTGDIVYSETDVLGDGVNVASRLESLAVPGSILISSKVLDDIQNQSDILTQSIGIFELKNVTTPVEIFAIANEGLVIPRVEDMAGKGKLQNTEKQNLPTQLTSFIGRDKEVEEIKALLLQKRLVTLTGPGGTGKTRLSIRVAEEVLSEFKDGVFFVPLAPIREADMLASAIAKVLEVEENPIKTVLESLKDFLKDKLLLLVLDNFEQITDAAPDVLDLLQHCRNLKIMVSSRILLRIRGEQEYPVEPLPLPDIKQRIDIEQLQQYSSIRLFIQRAKALKPNFELTTDNAADITQVCSRLDGLPLAIELAAARIKLFSPGSLLAKLAKSLDVLKIKESGRPARHETLRQTIDWSYELLSDEEQTLFQQLAVFTGSFRMEAIEKICQLESFPELDIYEGLEALVGKSLIRQTEDQQGDSQFILLETIKEFAWGCLMKTGTADELRGRHAQYFMEFVEIAAPELTKKDQAKWMDRIEANYDNIRAAILWALETGASEKGFRFGTAMWRFWIVRKRVEGWQRLEQLLQLPVKGELMIQRANTLSAMGATLNSRGDLDLARKILLESYSIFQKNDDKAGMAVVLNHLSSTEWISCHLQESIEYAEKALLLSQAVEQPRSISTSYNNLGLISDSRCQLNEASTYFLKGMTIRKEIGDIRGYAFMLSNLALVELRMGDYENAILKIKEAIQILEVQVRDKQLVAWAYTVNAHYLLAQNKLKAAKESAEKAVGLWSEAMNRNAETFATAVLVDTLIELGELEMANHYVQKIDSNTKSPYGGGHQLKVKIFLSFKQEKLQEAEAMSQTAISQLDKIEDYLSLAEVLELMAEIKFQLGHYNQSVHALICAKIFRKKRNLFLALRFVDRLTQLEKALKAQIGDDTFTNLEESLTRSFEEEMKMYLEN